jgi:hypothetical protein
MFEDRLKQFQELDNYEKSNLSHQNQLSEEKQRRNILQRNLYLSTSTWKKSQWIQVMVSMHQYNRNKISNLFQVCEKCHEDALEGNFFVGGMFNDTYPLAITTIHLTYDTLLCKIYKYNYK